MDKKILVIAFMCIVMLGVASALPTTYSPFTGKLDFYGFGEDIRDFATTWFYSNSGDLEFNETHLNTTLDTRYVSLTGSNTTGLFNFDGTVNASKLCLQNETICLEFWNEITPIFMNFTDNETIAIIASQEGQALVYDITNELYQNEFVRAQYVTTLDEGAFFVETSVEGQLQEIAGSINLGNSSSTWKKSVLSKSVLSPPLTPDTGDRYIIPFTVGGDWYGAAGAWDYRQSVTIESDQVEANQTNFPVTIIIDDSGNSIFGKAQTDGDDILFTSSDKTTKLSHELVYYDDGTGTKYLEAHVEVPVIANLTDTIIYMYYGNSVATSQEDSLGTWDSDYEAVFHMENLNATAINDSTGSYIGDLKNGVSETTGILSSAQSFDGINDYADTNINTDLPSGPFTISVWAKNIPSGSKYIVTQADSVSSYSSAFILGYGNNGLWFNGKTVYGGNIFSDGEWHQTVFSSDGTTAHLLLDGEVQSGTATPSIQSTVTSVKLMSSGVGTLTQYLCSGTMDEVRISTIQRSDEWINTEYENIANMDTFLTFGTVEISAATATEWTGSENNITTYNSTNWTFDTPMLGWAVIVEDEAVGYTWNGSDWTGLDAPINHNNLGGLDNCDDNGNCNHLSDSFFAQATRIATNALSGIMPAGKLDFWNNKYTPGDDLEENLKIAKGEPSIILEDSENETAYKISYNSSVNYLNITRGNMVEGEFNVTPGGGNLYVDGNGLFSGNITTEIGSKFGNDNQYLTFEELDFSGFGVGKYAMIKGVSDGALGNATAVKNVLAIIGSQEETSVAGDKDPTLLFTDSVTLASMNIGFNGSIEKGYFTDASYYSFDAIVNATDFCIDGGDCLGNINTGNLSWNQTFANTLYSDIKWGYNMTDTKYWNISNNQLLAYNTTIPMNLTSGLIVTGNTNLSFETYVGDGTSYLGIINYGGMGLPMIDSYSNALEGYMLTAKDSFGIIGVNGDPSLLFGNAGLDEDALIDFDRTNDIMKFEDASGGYSFDAQVNSSLDFCITGGNCLSDMSGSTFNTTYDNKISSQWTSDGANISYDSGNIGIGTTEPTAKLDIRLINGGGLVVGGVGASATGDFAVAIGDNANASGINSFAIGSGVKAEKAFDFATGVNTIASGGISTAMGNRINVSGTSSFGIGLNSSEYNFEQPNSMAIMGGNVGIDEVSPNQKLVVNGDLNFTGNLIGDYSTYNATYAAGGTGDNSSWNQTFANTLYAAIGSTGGNLSWNETRANLLYAGIEWDYNQTTSTYTLYNDIWSSTYNATYAASTGDNSSWNQTFANTLYAPIGTTGGNLSWNETRANLLYSGIEWDYNQTTATYNLYNDIWSSTYNATYASAAGDNSSWNQTYADTLYASYLWGYNQTLGVDQTYVEGLGFITGAHTIDTNESARFNNIVETNCAGNDKMIGVYPNGTIQCSAVAGGGDFSFVDFQASFNSNWSALDYDKWMYNQTTPANTYTDDVNFSQSSWINSVFLKIADMFTKEEITGMIDGNLTEANDYTDGIVTANNASWTTTYNESYAGSLNNASYLSTYNATYDAFESGGSSPWVSTATSIYNTTSDLGIGTATPQSKLDIVGNMSLLYEKDNVAGINYASRHSYIGEFANGAIPISLYGYIKSDGNTNSGHGLGVLGLAEDNIASAFALIGVEGRADGVSGVSGVIYEGLKAYVTWTDSNAGDTTSFGGSLYGLDITREITDYDGVTPRNEGLSFGVNVADSVGGLANAGVMIRDQTGALIDYGIVVEGADTSALWLSSLVDTTDSANGISFGLSSDTTLYRSGVSELTIDSNLVTTNFTALGYTNLSFDSYIGDGSSYFNFINYLGAGFPMVDGYSSALGSNLFGVKDKIGIVGVNADSILVFVNSALDENSQIEFDSTNDILQFTDASLYTFDAQVNSTEFCLNTGACLSTALQSIMTDTTPQLGGYLDTNGENIGSTSDEIENVYIAEDSRTYYGDAQESSIYFNGTDLVIEVS